MTVSNATLLAKISALEARVTKLAAQVKSDEGKLAPLIAAGASQGTFLAAINMMTTPGTYPLPTDSGSGSYWITGERDLLNGPINMDNLIVQKMQRANLMQ